MRIDVVRDRKGWKVLIDWIQKGVIYSDQALANKMAEEVHTEKHPHAELHLA